MTALPQSRAEAKRVGSSLYLTGLPCKNGHIAGRRTSNRLCVECGNNQARRWYERNTGLAKHRARAAKLADPEKTRAHDAKNREKYRLQINRRGRLYEVRRRTGAAIDMIAAVRFLGCSLDALRSHLEVQFQPGMSWENWGRQGWHIDHIKPLVGFNLQDEAQLRVACHYLNLQPLWWRDDIVKGHAERHSRRSELNCGRPR